MKTRQERLRAAACAAVDARVEPGMVVGLGTGSTASWAVRRI
ncbi:MAG: Ribose 5-phosphate isomerase A, partial [uncultured Rubrobacteraceae bacterium]